MRSNDSTRCDVQVELIEDETNLKDAIVDRFERLEGHLDIEYVNGRYECTCANCRAHRTMIHNNIEQRLN